MSTPTVDQLIVQAKDIINKILAGKTSSTITIFDVATIAMGIVRRTNADKVLTQAEQKELVIATLDTVIKVLVKLNKISQQQADSLESDIKTYSNFIPQFIDAASFIATNSEIISLEKDVKGCCKKGKCTIV